MLGDVSDEGRMFVYSVLGEKVPDLVCEAGLDAIFRLDGDKVIDQLNVRTIYRFH